MKKFILFPALTCLAAQLSFGQQTSPFVDSIKNELQRHTTADTTRINLLILLGNSVYHDKPEDGIRYSDEAIDLSRKIKWPSGVARGYRLKGVIYYTLSDYLKAIDNLQISLKEHPAEADRRFEGSIYNNMGNVYSELSNYTDALDNFQKYLSLAREFGWKHEEAIALMNMGLVYMKEGKSDTAIRYFNTSIDSAGKIGFKQVIAYALTNKGAALDKAGRYDEAMAAFRETIPIADSLNDRRIKSEALAGLAEASVFKKEYAPALLYAQASLALSKELNIVQYQKETYGVLSDIYTAQHKPDSALAAYKTFIALRDSVINEDKRSEIVRTEMKFQLEKQQALAAAEIDRERLIRNAVAGGLLVLLLAAIVSFVFYKRRRDARQRQKEAEFRAQVLDTEMKALRAQMNPHFIFNSLNSISHFILKNNLQDADDYLVKFSQLMRAILENSEKKEVSLESDLKALELYMQLEQTRLNHKFTYAIRLGEDIDVENTLVPPLILQPFVENSIWHGISKKEGQGRISVYISRRGDMISCVVEDDGVGMRGVTEGADGEGMRAGGDGEGTPPERKSLGMKITRSRIEIINRTKSTNASVTLSPLEQGTRAEIILPYTLNF